MAARPRKRYAQRRQATRALAEPWPFLYSVIPGRGIVQNVQKEGKPRKTVKKPLPKV